jgi:hypothetical protein
MKDYGEKALKSVQGLLAHPFAQKVRVLTSDFAQELGLTERAILVVLGAVLFLFLALWLLLGLGLVMALVVALVVGGLLLFGQAKRPSEPVMGGLAIPRGRAFVIRWGVGLFLLGLTVSSIAALLLALSRSHSAQAAPIAQATTQDEAPKGFAEGCVSLWVEAGQGTTQRDRFRFYCGSDASDEAWTRRARTSCRLARAPTTARTTFRTPATRMPGLFWSRSGR